MKPFLCLPILLLPVTARAADPVVKVAGIQAVWDDGSKDFGMFKTYNSEKGVGVTLIVSSDKQIVAFDESKVALKIGGATAKTHFFGGDSAFSKDHHAIRLEFETAGAYQTAADGTLKITGDIPLTFATGKDETKSAPFAIAANTAVTFPGAKPGVMPTLKVTSSGKPKFGDGGFEIVFSTDRKPEEFAGIRFTDKNGKDVESNRTSTMWSGFGGKGSGEVTFSFKTAPTDLIAVVGTYTGSEKVNAKVDLSAGLTAPKL